MARSTRAVFPGLIMSELQHQTIYLCPLEFPSSTSCMTSIVPEGAHQLGRHEARSAGGSESVIRGTQRGRRTLMTCTTYRRSRKSS
jgi:hypothetical protein